MDTIFQHLLQLFALGFMAMFASGPIVVNEGSVTPPPSETTKEETTEETSGEETTDEAIAEGGVEGKPAVTEPPTVDWKVIPQEVKAHVQTISKDNPKLGNLLQNAIYTSQTFMREFPKGLREAQELKRSIEEAGGLDEIQNLRATHQALTEEQEAMDNQARSGDPAVLDNFMEIAGDGFNKLMPVALDRWMSRDPEMYSHVMGKVMVSSLQEGGVVSKFNMALQMLALNNPEATKLAMQNLKEAADWMNQLNTIATKVPKKPEVDPQIASQQKEIDDEKAKIFNTKFSSQFGAWRNQEIRAQLKVLAPKRTLTEYQMNTFGQKVIDEIKGILTADEEYMRNLERTYNSRDMAALLKFTKSRNSKLLPDVSRRVFRQLFSETSLGGKKKPAIVEAKPGEKAPVTEKPNQQGWVKISADKAPRPDQIDNKASDFKLKFKKAAILLDGRKVYWGDKAPE